MGKHTGQPARQHRNQSRTVYITTTIAGLFVGISAWTMSHPTGPAVPTVSFSTAADTPVPTPHRTGFTLTP